MKNPWDHWRPWIPTHCFRLRLPGRIIVCGSLSSASGEWNSSSTHPSIGLLDIWVSLSSFPSLVSLMTEDGMGTLGNTEPYPTFLWSSSILWTRASFFLSCWKRQSVSVHLHTTIYLSSFSWLFFISPQWYFPTETPSHFMMPEKNLWFDLNMYTPNFKGQRWPHVGLPILNVTKETLPTTFPLPCMVTSAITFELTLLWM